MFNFNSFLLAGFSKLSLNLISKIKLLKALFTFIFKSLSLFFTLSNILFKLFLKAIIKVSLYIVIELTFINFFYFYLFFIYIFP